MEYVALLAEGVDRNGLGAAMQGHQHQSPSSRRAWIEICRRCTKPLLSPVALLAEGVDRNHEITCAEWAAIGRPPRGGRG